MKKPTPNPATGRIARLHSPERIAARREAQAASRARKAACDAEWAEAHRVDPDEDEAREAERIESNAVLRDQIREARAAVRATAAERRRIAHTARRRGPRPRGAGPRRAATRSSARSGDSGDDSDGEPAGPPPAPLAGASEEVLAHHAAQHSCADPGVLEIPCPCGDAIALVCDACEQAVFVAVQPGTWCEHAQQLAGVSR